MQFPIRPVLHQDEAGNIRMFRTHEKLITPPDFDYSPYFNVIKYPLLDLDELGVYRKLPWDRSGVHCDAFGDSIISDTSSIMSKPVIEDHDERNDDTLNEVTPGLAPQQVK